MALVKMFESGSHSDRTTGRICPTKEGGRPVMVPQYVENFRGFRTRRVINGQRHQSLIRTQALDPEDRLRLERLQGSSQPSLVQPPEEFGIHGKSSRTASAAVVPQASEVLSEAMPQASQIKELRPAACNLRGHASPAGPAPMIRTSINCFRVSTMIPRTVCKPSGCDHREECRPINTGVAASTQRFRPLDPLTFIHRAAISLAGFPLTGG
jgi:hypothetical protein